MNTRELIEKCRDALAEEISAWDIDPPLFHVKEAHDACVAWLAAPAAPGEPQRVQWVDGVGAMRASIESCRDGVSHILVNGRCYYPLTDAAHKSLVDACFGRGEFPPLSAAHAPVPLTDTDVVEAWRTTDARRDDYGWTSCEWFQAGVRFARRHYGIDESEREQA